MKRIIRIFWLSLALVANACGQKEAPEAPTAISIPTSAATAEPDLTGTPASTPSFFPVATQPDEQVYIDPGGWYALNLPSAWRAAAQQGVFRGEDGFLETGYLPEMMFMGRALDVCQWLANVDTKETYSVYWPGAHDGCALISLPGIAPAAKMEIIENPAGELPQRFLYIKTDPAYFDRITGSFAWLQPIDGRGEPALHLAPMRPEDISFWEDTVPLEAGFSIREYALPKEAQLASPTEKIFLEFIPPEAPQEERKPGTEWFSDTVEDVNDKVEPFGYEFRPGSQPYLFQMYREGALLVEHVYTLPDIYNLSSAQGDRLVFLVYSLVDPELGPFSPDNMVAYLVQNDAMTRWEHGPPNPMDLELPPVLYKGDVLWLQVAKNIRLVVKNSRREVLYTFATYFGASLPVRGFRGWDDHWILEVSDFVIQDGEVLNEKFGFEEVFHWRPVNDQSFYFFRKGPRVGISYDGGFLPVYYHEVAHGLCCGLALNNPRLKDNTLRFFGKRDGVWYYVITEFH